MMDQRQLFFEHIAQTSPFPPALEFVSAKGMYLFDKSGTGYMDLISGIAVSNVGHGNPEVISAIQEQAAKHLHVMVYGEYIQSSQVQFAKLLTDLLPPQLSAVYFVNSGSEAIEGAMKLSKRYTGRTEIISFRNAYHGSTQGALSVAGNEELKNAFRPLLPDVRTLNFNGADELLQITNKTACVLLEVIQGEAGVIIPSEDYLKALRKRCDATGTLLIIDEIQTGMGRTGKNFAFEHYRLMPDILCLGKALGGGLPLGAFIASKEIMKTLTEKPVLGHITTFGGHPLSCAAGMAALEFSLKENLAEKAESKGQLLCSLLHSKQIKEIRRKGLLIAIDFGSEETNMKMVSGCVEKKILTDWFLFNKNAMRLAPPLTITEAEIHSAANALNEVMNS